MDRPFKVSTNRFSKARFLYPHEVEEENRRLSAIRKQKELKNLQDLQTRRAKIESLRNEYKDANLDLLLLEQGCDLNNLPINVEWLPLEMFDDTRFEDRSPQDWFTYYTDEEGNRIDFTGRALVKDENEMYFWEPVLVSDYEEDNKMFIVQFEDGEQAKVKR